MSRQFLQNPALRQATTMLFGSGKSPMSAVHSWQAAPPFSPRGSVRGAAHTPWLLGQTKEGLAQLKAEVQGEALSRVETMPISKFRYIAEIAPSVKKLFIENTSIAILKGGLPSLFDQSEIVKNAESLRKELASLSREGDQNAIAMAQLIKDAALGNVTQSYISDGIPPFTITGLGESALREVMRFKVRVEDQKTSFAEFAPGDNPYANALQQAPSISLTYAMCNLISKSNYPTAISCFRTTNSQTIHSRPNIDKNRVSATALIGINADGSVVTYMVDAAQIVHFLDEDEIKLLMQKKFYHPERLYGDENKANEFAILEKVAGKWCLRLEDSAFISKDLGYEAYNKYNLILEKIDHVVALLLQEEKVTKVAVKTGEYAMMNNLEAAWGRNSETEANSFDVNAKPNSKVEFRRVMNVSVTQLQQPSQLAK